MTAEAWTPGQLGLRLLVALGPLVAVLATGLVGHPPEGWLLLLTLALALVFAWQPESVLGTAVMVLVLLWWGVSLRDGLHPEALVAAAGLLVSHVAATLASYGPGALPVDPALARRWLVRGVLVFLAAPATWLVATGLRGPSEVAGVWVVGLVGAVAAVSLAGLAFNVGTARDAD